MTRTGWAISLRDPEEYVRNPRTGKMENKPIGSPVGNFKNFGDRQLDNVMVFNSIYGLKHYMIWEMHQNLGFYDFGSVLLNLRLFHDGNPNAKFWNDLYRPISIKYSTKRSKYILYAVSEDSLKLDMDCINPSVSFDTGKKGWEVLQEINKTKGYFAKVVYHESGDPSLQEPLLYMLPNLYDIRVYDLIRYICDECGYEWCIRKDCLHVGPELNAIYELQSGFKTDIATDKVSETAFFKYYSGSTIPADILSNWSQTWRCIWVKHAAGACGGVTKACFAEIGSRQIYKERFIQSLDPGKRESLEASKLLRPTKGVNMMIGNILTDLGENEFIDEISIQKNRKKKNETVPYNIQIDRSEGEEETIVENSLNKVSRLTPYLDENAGLLFPSQTPSTHPPNCVVGFPEQRIESPVVLGFLYGNGRGVTLPTKAQKEDMKLRLPNGWCFYVDGKTGETIIRKEDAEVEGKPSTNVEVPYIQITKEGGVNICAGSEADVRLISNTGRISLFEGGCCWIMSESYTIQFDGSDGTMYINGDGPMTLNGSSIKVGSGATLHVSLEDHTHNYTLLSAAQIAFLTGIGMPPAFGSGTTGTPSSNSTKTKVE